jgi:hypothetical protein
VLVMDVDEKESLWKGLEYICIDEWCSELGGRLTRMI